MVRLKKLEIESDVIEVKIKINSKKKKENEIKGRTKGARTTAAAAKLFLALADTRLTD